MRRKLTIRAMTLLELLVALTLGVMLAGAVQSLVVRAYRNAALLEQRVAADDLHEAPLRLLECDLNALAPGSGVQVDERGLSFTTENSLNPAVDAARHAVAVRYSRVAPGTSEVWIRSERQYGVETLSNEIVIGSEAEQVTYSVYDGESWHSTWVPPTVRMALALRIEFRLVGNAHTRVIPLQPLRWRSHRE